MSAKGAGMRGRSRGVAAAVAGLVLFAGSGGWAQLPTPYSFRGKVSDPIGRPLAAATVTDGIRSTTTAADGTYALTEDSTGTFTLTASRSDANASSKVLTVTTPQDTPVDFTLTYRLSGSLAAPFLSAASSAASTTLSVRSFAPSPGSSGSGTSCVTVTDSRTAATSPATFVGSNADGSFSWRWELTVPRGTPNGQHTLTYSAKDCAGATLLTNLATSTYTVDSTPPVIDPRSVSPPDFGNTVFTSQPLLAKLFDQLSGLDAQSTVFTLTDETTGVQTSHPAVNTSGATQQASASQAAAAAAPPASTWWRTAAVALVAAHVYRVRVQAKDLAGNTATSEQVAASQGGGLLVTTVAPAASTARIPPTSCTVGSQVDPVTQTKQATCPAPPLDLDATSVTLGGNRHGVADASFVEHTATLEGAVLKTTVGGVQVSQKAYPPGATHTASMRYDVPESFTSAQTLSVPAMRATMATLTTTVPSTWTSATLEMAPAPTAATTSACADPSTQTGDITCTPDPVLHRYVVVLQDSVADPSAVASEHSSKHGAQVKHTYRSVFKGYAGPIPFPGVRSILNDSRVQLVARDVEGVLDAQELPTGVDRVGADAQHAKQKFGDRVNVAVLDSGIEVLHPDLQENIAPQVGIDCATGANPVVDANGHGTGVAGIIAAADNDIGVVGVAPKAKLWNVKVAVGTPQHAGLLESAVLCGLEFVYQNAPANNGPIKVANMSLHFPGRDDAGCSGGTNLFPFLPLHRAVCKVDEAGVVIVVAAGNLPTTAPRDFKENVPAAYDEVITVTNLADYDGKPCGLTTPDGALQRDDTFSTASYHGSNVEQPDMRGRDLDHTVGAPGTVIKSTSRPVPNPLNPYATFNGTSFSAPHVAGAAALYVKKNPQATRAEVLRELRKEQVGEYLRSPGACTPGTFEHTDPSGLHPEPVLRVDNLDLGP